ncbi:MAG: hypothetical protein V1702_03695 [Candidatus Woesearchaeota archaeon]
MGSEGVIAVKQPYSFFENAVNQGIRESGLAEKLQEAADVELLRDYLTVLMGAFTFQGAMDSRYHTQRAKFAALTGEYHFDTVLKNLHQGDVWLFRGLFLPGGYRVEAGNSASGSYRSAASWLWKTCEEHRFLQFLSESAHDLIEILSCAAVALNLPKGEKSDVMIYLPALERYLGRS